MTRDEWQENQDLRERLAARQGQVHELWIKEVEQPERLVKAAEDFCSLYPEIAADEAKRCEAYRMEARMAKAGDKRDPLDRFKDVGERMERGENEADLEYEIEQRGFK